MKSFSTFIKNHRLFVLLACGTLCFAWTSLFYLHSTFPTGDEPHYLVISQTLLKYHSLNVSLDYQHGDFHAFYPGPIRPHVVPNMRGQLLPVQNIGAPVLWLLPFSLLGRLGAMLFISLVSVLIVYNMYKLMLLLGIKERYAFLVCAAYIVASPLYLYSHLTFVEPIGAFLCIAIARRLFQQKVTVRELLISSILLGILPWVHIRFALFEIILFFPLLYKIYKQYKFKNVLSYVAYLAPVSILFAAIEIYNFIVWGTFNPAANQINDKSVPFQVSPLKGLVGTFFDQQYGLLMTFPLFLFLFIGIILAMKKQYRQYNVLMIALSLPYLLIVNSFSLWSGGWSPPARFILVLLPLYSFYIAFALEQMRSVPAYLTFAVTVGYGFFYNLRTLTVSSFGFNGETGRNSTLFDLHLFNRPITDYQPSLYLPHQEGLLSLWIGGTILVCVVLFFSRRRRTMRHSIPSTNSSRKLD